MVGNRFTTVLREVQAGRVLQIASRVEEIGRSGLPNYFDEQRFGSVASGEEHLAKLILRRDAEGAVRAYLSQPFAGDPRAVRAFKRFASRHWGDWEALFVAAPRPSNFRSVLTYLRDHPTEDPEERAFHFRKALNLINRRLLSIYLSAYQSLLWNRIAGRYLATVLGSVTSSVQIAGEALPLYRSLPAEFVRDLKVALPNHRATYGHPLLAAIAAEVLSEEGLKRGDLKARILKKAYLTKVQRSLLLFPETMAMGEDESDELFPEHRRLTLAFALPRGSYATLVLKALDA
jgi:tRNA pseudouridine13 synthase